MFSRQPAVPQNLTSLALTDLINHFSQKNTLLLLSIIIVLLRKSESFDKCNYNEMAHLQRKLAELGVTNLGVSFDYLAELRDRLIPFDGTIRQKYFQRTNPGSQIDPNYEYRQDYSYSNTTPTKQNLTRLKPSKANDISDEQRNYKTLTIDDDYRVPFTEALMKKLRSPNDFDIHRDALPFLLRFLLKEEMGFIDNVYKNINLNGAAQQNTSEVKYSLIDSYITKHAYKLGDCLKFDLVNPDNYLFKYVATDQTKSAFLLRRGEFGENYFDKLCFIYSEKGIQESILAYPPTRAGKKKLQNDIQYPIIARSRLKVLPILNNEHWDKASSYTPPQTLVQPNNFYEITKPEELNLDTTSIVLLPSIGGLSLLAIAYLGLYHAFHLKHDYLIVNAQDIFETILKKMNQCLGVNVKNKIIPMLYNKQVMDANGKPTYIGMDIRQHLCFCLNPQLKFYAERKLKEYGFTVSLFNMDCGNGYEANSLVEHNPLMQLNLENPFVGLSKNQNVIYRQPNGPTQIWKNNLQT